MVDSEVLEINFILLFLSKMKYHIEWEYKDQCMSGCLELNDWELNELKDFVMHGLPSLIQDLFERIWKKLKDESHESPDKIIGVMSLIALMTQNRLSEYLTESLDKMLWEEDNNKEGVEINPREILHD